MSLPSPDKTLVSAMDDLLGIPQRQGVPLPSVLMTLPVVVLLGYSLALVAAVAMAAAIPPHYHTNGWFFVAVLSLGTLLNAWTGYSRVGRYRSAARSWTPAVADRYRADASRARQTKAHARYLMLAMTMFAAGFGFLVLYDLGTILPGFWLAISVFGLALGGLGNLLVYYGDCVMPRASTPGRPVVG